MNCTLINRREDKLFINNFYIADTCIRLLTGCLLIFFTWNYFIYVNRPAELFEPINSFHKWIMPNLPSLPVFLFVVTSCAALLGYTSKNRKWIPQLLLFIGLLYLNSIRFGYHVVTHIHHSLILYYFFTLFIPKQQSINVVNQANLSDTIRWSLAGLLITYSMAGFWKFVGLGKHLLTQSDSIHWLHKAAIEYNAITSRKNHDMQVSEVMLQVYDIPYVWEIFTLIMFSIQFVAVFAAVNKKISNWVLVGIVGIHIFNSLFFNIHFPIATVFIILLLFPYSSLFSEK